MPSIRCGKCSNAHESVEQVKACYAGTLSVPASEPVPVAAVSAPSYAGESVSYGYRATLPVSPRQAWKIRSLGGNPAEVHSLAEASALIDHLLGKAGVQSVTYSRPAPPPTLIPLELLNVIPEGRFATRPDSETPYTFVRITKPTKGKFVGAVKVQTQHGDVLDMALTYYPESGHYRFWRDKASCEAFMLLLIVDYQQAMIQYGREIGRCCVCGKTLTDERSRHYGIGPECEKFNSWVIDRVDEEEED